MAPHRVGKGDRRWKKWWGCARGGEGREPCPSLALGVDYKGEGWSRYRWGTLDADLTRSHWPIDTSDNKYTLERTKCPITNIITQVNAMIQTMTQVICHKVGKVTEGRFNINLNTINYLNYVTSPPLHNRKQTKYTMYIGLGCSIYRWEISISRYIVNFAK